jgi:hypothetical protein
MFHPATALQKSTTMPTGALVTSKFISELIVFYYAIANAHGNSLSATAALTAAAAPFFRTCAM